MNRFAFVLPLLALTVALAPAVPAQAQAARDFQLPPAPTPTQDSRVQGPVDSDAPVPVRPRAIETARPTSAPTTGPVPLPPASVPPAIVLPTPAPTASAPRAAGSAPDAAPVQQGTQTANAANNPLPSAIPGVPTTIPSSGIAALRSDVARDVAPARQPAARSTVPWLWIALGVLGCILAIGVAFARRRRSKAPRVAKIVAPVVPSTLPAEALAITVEAMRMDRSILNATVGYRVTLRNRTTRALNGVAVEADLVSASGSAPAEQQIASPAQPLTPRHAAGRLAPGQSMRFEGQVRLPLAEASAVWQGRAALLVPLLRVRATAEGALPIATTLVIGQSAGRAARPQPFRLDEPPRSYAPLAQRVLDAAPAGA